MTGYIFAGIDLGDKKSVAKLATDKDSSERFVFTNSRAGRARLFAELQRRSCAAGGAKILMAYEASSCGYVLRDEASALGMVCHVLAPTKMDKSVEKKKHKNDDRDADDVLDKLRGHILAGNRLPTIWVPDMETRDDRELVRTRVECGDKLTRVKTQSQMLLKRHGVEKPADIGSSGTIGHFKWLEALSKSQSLGWSTRHSLASLVRQLKSLEEELAQLDEALGQLAQHPRHARIVDELTKEKGVGLLTAMVYRTEIADATRFKRGRYVGKYFGLTPTSQESGQQSDRKGHISRQGPHQPRKVLCQASWVHIRYDSESRKIYQRLVDRNPKKKKIALVAIMRRLSVRLWHRMVDAQLQMAAMTR